MQSCIRDVAMYKHRLFPGMCHSYLRNVMLDSTVTVLYAVNGYQAFKPYYIIK